MLLDINLEELKFLIDPSYEFIKDKIPYIMEAYIKVYGEEYREHIEDNFGKINYVFLNEFDDLNIFITKFQNQLILEIYNKLYSAFHLKFSEVIYEQPTNFIEKIFLNKGLSFIANDNQLQILRNEVREHLIDIKKNEQEELSVKFLEEQIQYINDTAVKFDQIMEILNPQIKLIDDIKNKRKKIKASLQKKFITDHGYLLSEEEINFIAQNDDYDVIEFVKNSENLGKYIYAEAFNDEVFCIGKIGYFAKEYNDSSICLDKRKELLVENGIDYKEAGIDLSDGDKLLKRMGIYYIDENNHRCEGLLALTKLEEELNNYDNMLYDASDKYLMTREKFIEKYILGEDFIQRKSNKHNKNILSKLENLSYIGDEFFEIGENSGFNDFLSLPKISGNISNDGVITNFDITIPYVYFSPIKSVLLSDGQISSTLSLTLGHESGHVATINNSITGLNLNRKMTLFNELFNQYMNQKKNQIMDPRGILFNSIVNDDEKCVYDIDRFLLEPVVEKYENEIKHASMHNSTDEIVEFMGFELFEKYLDVINTFYQHQETMLYYSDIFTMEPDYVEAVKKQLSDIMVKVDERNLSTRHKTI